MRSVAAIILAAGSGTRFGADTPKLLSDLAGKPLIRHAAEAATAARADPVVVVVGRASKEIEAALAGVPCAFIRNDDPAAGLSRSLALGLAALPDEARGAVILLADMPGVGARTIDRLIEAFETTSLEPRAVVPMRNGQRGNPVLLGRAMFDSAMALTGDQGARKLLDDDQTGILALAVEDDGITLDIDTKADLAALARRLRDV